MAVVAANFLDADAREAQFVSHLGVSIMEIQDFGQKKIEQALRLTRFSI